MKLLENEIQDYTTNANSVKEIIIARLHQDKVINDEQAKEYVNKWQVIIIKQGWFKRWMDFFKRDNPDNYVFKFVKFDD